MIKLVNRVLVAGPTTGKSTAIEMALASGFTTIDTDDLTRDISPEWFENKLWQKQQSDPKFQKQREMLDVVSGAYCAHMLRHNKDLLIFSNLWGQHFIAGLDEFAPDGKLPLFVFRENAEEITALSQARGGEVIPLKIAQHWVASSQKWAASVAKRVVWLKEGEFLTDVIDFSNFFSTSDEIKAPIIAAKKKIVEENVPSGEGAPAGVGVIDKSSKSDNNKRVGKSSKKEVSDDTK
jgi:hypothetical protein